MKTTAHRIAYYVHKASAYSAARFDILRNRPAKKPPANRLKRLLAYKAALGLSKNPPDDPERHR